MAGETFDDAVERRGKGRGSQELDESTKGIIRTYVRFGSFFIVIGIIVMVANAVIPLANGSKADERYAALETRYNELLSATASRNRTFDYARRFYSEQLRTLREQKKLCDKEPPEGYDDRASRNLSEAIASAKRMNEMLDALLAARVTESGEVRDFLDSRTNRTQKAETAKPEKPKNPKRTTVWKTDFDGEVVRFNCYAVNGHQYVVLNDLSTQSYPAFLHDPDCPCFSRKWYENLPASACPHRQTVAGKPLVRRIPGTDLFKVDDPCADAK